MGVRDGEPRDEEKIFTLILGTDIDIETTSIFRKFDLEIGIQIVSFSGHW